MSEEFATESVIEQVMDKIAEAHIAFGERICSICKEYDDETLLGVAAEFERRIGAGDSLQDHFRAWRDRVLYEIRFRHSMKRAEEVLGAGASAYCVFHDYDADECWRSGLHE